MRTRAGRARQARQAGALFSKLPDDLQLAVLARVPYSDLHGGVAAACKAWSTIVASKPFRETRAAAGCDEFGLLVSLWGARALVEPRVDTPMQCFLVTAAGARRALPPPSGTENFFTVALGQDVYFLGHNRIGDGAAALALALHRKLRCCRQLAIAQGNDEGALTNLGLYTDEPRRGAGRCGASY